MKQLKHIALVGRPNVGKSRLFNRLVGRRMSIVHDQPGVTRDIVSATVEDHFILMDTGGLGMTKEMSATTITEATEDQVDFAIQAAEAVFFVVDSQDGLLPQDNEIAKRLRRFGKEVFLVVNKVDQEKQTHRVDEFHSLGFKRSFSVSAEHGRGTDNLLANIKDFIGPKPEFEEDKLEDKRIRICFAGRPNVGKSSLTNCLLNEKRMIVSSMPGTTRDAVEKDLDYQSPENNIWPFRLIDTAGVRSKSKVDSSVEFFSGLRSIKSIQRADVVFLVIDTQEGVTKQDKKIAGESLESGRTVAVIINKWDYAQEAFSRGEIDGYENLKDFRKAYAEATLKELFFLPSVPVIFTSAVNNYAIDRILKQARALYQTQRKEIQTSQINKLFQSLLASTPPRFSGRRRFKIYYAVQTGVNPISIRIFCNQTSRLDKTYKRYLQTNFNQTFNLKGCPVVFEFIGKPPRDNNSK